MFTSQFLGMRATNRIKLTLRRPDDTNGGSYIDGVWTPSATSTDVIIDANVQPLGYKETMLLEASDRSKKALRVYSPSPMFSQEENENGPDEFDWEGDTFEIMKVLNFSMGVLNHWKAIAIMKEKINESV